MLPLRDKQIRFAFFCIVAIGREDQLAAVRTEHREAVEHGAVCELRESRSIQIDHFLIQLREPTQRKF